MKLAPVSPRAPLALLDRHARVADAPDDDKLEKKTAEQVERIADLQRIFYADGRFALLIVLQGRDASGKDGTFRKVFTGVNPQGISVTSFKVPTEEERLQKRLDNSEKNWKFSSGDLAERAKWNAYTAAYRDAMRRCSTRWAPWYVVPADDKKVRNYLIARTVADTLRSLDLRWPKADPEVLE